MNQDPIEVKAEQLEIERIIALRRKIDSLKQ